MIRKFFTSLLILVLVCLSGYNYYQVQQLTTQNKALTEANERLQLAVNERHNVRHHKATDVQTTSETNPIEEAQRHIALAEKLVSEGNIGDAVAECKLAGSEITRASSSTSSNVNNSLAAVKAKLNSVNDETKSLWQKIGAQ